MNTLHVAESAALGATRALALRAMLDAAFEGDFSDDDWRHALGGTHVWVEQGGAVLCHASLVPRRLECAGRVLRAGYVEAVATAAPHRGRGLATRVMRRIGELVAARFDIGALSTGEHGFYARLGWQRWTGPSFVDAPGGRLATPGDDGGLMILATPRIPSLDVDGPLVADWRSGDVW